MKYRWNQVKQLMMALLMVVVVGGGGLGGQIYASSKLENGTYTIKNQIYHDSQIGQGMARSYTEEESELKMSSDGLFATVGFNNTQFMGDFKVTVNSQSVSYETVVNDMTANIKKIKFLIPSVDAKVTIGLYVIPMDTEVSYELTFDKESLELIEKEGIKEAEQSVQSEIIKREVTKTEATRPEIVKPEEIKPEEIKPEEIKPETLKPDQVKQIEPVNKPIEQEKVEEAQQIEAKEKIIELVQQPTQVVQPTDETSQVKDESKADKLNVNESKEIKIEADELEEKIVEETSKEEDSLEIDQREEIKEPKSEPELGSEQLEQKNNHTLILVVSAVIVLVAVGASSIYFFKRK